MLFLKKLKKIKILTKLTNLYIAFPPLSFLLSGRAFLIVLFLIYLLGYDIFSNPIIIVWSIFSALNRLAIIIGVTVATDAEYEK
jgi:hypothetical protein